MERQPSPLRLNLLWCAVLFVSSAFADNQVTVNAWARSDYVKRRESDGKIRQETYVFGAGRYFSGSTVDHSIDGLPFREIAEFLAPELARRNYLPTAAVNQADLLLVVHWGTTMPRVTLDQMRGTTDFSIDHADERAAQREFNDTMGISGLVSDVNDADLKTGFEQGERLTDDLDRDARASSNAQLLGYTQELRRFSNGAKVTEEEATLRANLEEERYFIIIKAYDFQRKLSLGPKNRPLWTLHLNMRSPGQNFKTAMTCMSNVAADYFGRKMDGLKVGRPGVKEGTVKLAPLIIIGEVK